MKRRRPAPAGDDLLREYDFRPGVRGKYARRFAQGTNIVVLDPDVAEVFPDSTSVNDALRALARVAALGRRQRRGSRAANGR
jgi:hypothetical protein